MDIDRSAVYAAESAAFDGTDLEDQRQFEQLADLTVSMTTCPWWPGPVVAVRLARRDARSSSTRCEADRRLESTTISLASEQLTTATLAHELAHALAGVRRGHDATFRAAYLDVVAVMTNLDPRDRRRNLHVAQLGSAFEAAGLDVGSRHWSAPPASVAGPIAL